VYSWSNDELGEFEGALICLRLVGRKWNEEKVMKAVERLSVVLGVQDPGTRLPVDLVSQTMKSQSLIFREHAARSNIDDRMEDPG
jgi:hypothetical protein